MLYYLAKKEATNLSDLSEHYELDVPVLEFI